MTSITHAKQKDLPDMLQMIRALSSYHGDTAQVTLNKLQEIFFGAAPTATALIAEQNTKAIGYAALTPLIVIHDGKIRFDIHHLFVTEPHRGKGIGTALITAAKAHAIRLGATRLTIGTDAGNQNAIAAYRAMPLLTEITGEGPRFRVDLTA